MSLFVFSADRSSNVDFLAYDPGKKKLYVKYRRKSGDDDKLYSAENLPHSAYTAIIQSSSIGSALNDLFTKLRSQNTPIVRALTPDEKRLVFETVAAARGVTNTSLMQDVGAWQAEVAVQWF